MNLGTTQHVSFPLATVVTRKGQITIPASIRDALGIKQGDALSFELAGQEIKLKPASSILAAGYQSIPALTKTHSEQEIEEILRDDAAEAYAKKGSR